MSHVDEFSIDGIVFENVTCRMAGRDPVLERVDFDFPLDQTILLKSSLPDQAVVLLEILAGRREPETGRVLLNGMDQALALHSIPTYTGCAFEKDRPDLNTTLLKFLQSKGGLASEVNDALEFFEWQDFGKQKISQLPYSQQKLAQLIFATLKRPQILLLEDPATGLTEAQFLDYLDWIQLGQRSGSFRHVFMTNNHPTAARHLDATILYVEDGLLFLDEVSVTKKAVHF